jgi:hypothetical protein
MENRGDARDLLACARFQIRAVEIEQHVGHIDDEPALCFSGFEDRVQLRTQLLSELRLLTLGLFCGTARLLCLRVGGRAGLLCLSFGGQAGRFCILARLLRFRADAFRIEPLLLRCCARRLRGGLLLLGALVRKQPLLLRLLTLQVGLLTLPLGIEAAAARRADAAGPPGDDGPALRVHGPVLRFRAAARRRAVAPGRFLPAAAAR